MEKGEKPRALQVLSVRRSSEPQQPETHKTTMQTEKRVLMENTAFILYEKFCSDSGEQRREQFKKAFERYLTDALQNDTPIPLQDGA